MGLKILLLSHRFHPSVGGIETFSEILASSFSNAHHDVHVLTWSEDRMGKAFPYSVIRNPSFRELCKEHAWADFVLENNPCLQLSWPGVLYKRPFLVVLQTWLPRENRGRGFMNRIKSMWLKRASKVIAISEAVRRQSWPPAIVVGNSYDAERFTIIPGIVRSRDFVFVGRLVSDKGAILAIEAVNLLTSRSFRDASRKNLQTLTIIGDGPEKPFLEELVVKLQLQEQVQFTGALSGLKLTNCLNQHRFLLVPSVWEEPFGIVALEGIACGCLPIVSDGGGLPDAIGNAGLTFRSGDVHDLVKCIRKVSDDQELEQSLRLAAKNHLAKHHPDEISTRYLDIIKEVVHSHCKGIEDN